MRQLFAHNTPARLLSTAGTCDEIQIVSTSENVVLDIATWNHSTAGHLLREHVLANRPLAMAIRLRALLGEAIESALDCEPRQADLWSDATTRATARRVD
jgi:hypothetical protein